MRETVLVVDDEPNILTSLRRALEVEEYRAVVAQSGAEALVAAQGKEAPNIVLLDVAMPQMDGLEVLRQLKEKDASLPVIMMSGHSTIETAVQATKLGAYDFVEKPLSTERLLIAIQNALDAVRLRQENAQLRKLAGDGEMIGQGPKMKQIFDTIGKAAPTNGRVLITGPNGTGKELVARALHRGSKRVDKPFIKVNCAAIPQELIESELFGHEKGSFTGATTQRRGKFEQADSGTLFLDEIGDMSLDAQAKVLRVLQEGELERVGGAETLTVDVRVIAATNKELAEEIAAGRFREDLFYRLNVVPIALPPLRERKEDVAQLVDYFLDQCCTAHGMRPKKIEQSAVSLLMQHDWPGNVRELRNTIERLVILGEGDLIGADDVQAILPQTKAAAGKHYQAGASLREMVSVAERDLILQALQENDAQVSRTAAALQIERSHLYKKMRALGIDPKSIGE